MIFTSYFAKIKKLPDNVIPVAICAKVPDWYKGLRYLKLAPKYDALMKYKKTGCEDCYVDYIDNELMGNLSLEEVLNDLRNLADCDNNHIALVCYEKPDDFCHRHFVAEWLRTNGVECKEWEE